MQSEQVSRFYSYDCNKLEEEEGLRDCAPTNELDYALVERNPVYEFHNPRQQRSRTRETSGLLYSQTANIDVQLAASGLPAGLSDYVIEELEAGVSVYSDTGNRAVQLMDHMVDRSEAAIMAERLFDPWVQNQTRLLEERRYYSRQALAEESNCLPPKLFTLPAQEFAKCLLMETGSSIVLKLFGL